MTDLDFSKEAKNLKLGIYEHYKKKRYKVLGVSLHSETLEELVIYKALYGKKLTWVRPLKMFLDIVNVNGLEKLRFRFIKK